MAKTTMAVGGVLVALGVICWIITEFASWTALIPAILGVLLVVCGQIGVQRPQVGIHAALVVALVGAAGTLPNVFGISELLAGDAERPVAVIASVITFVVLVGYLVVAIRSFIAARRTTN